MLSIKCGCRKICLIATSLWTINSCHIGDTYRKVWWMVNYVNRVCYNVSRTLLNIPQNRWKLLMQEMIAPSAIVEICSSVHTKNISSNFVIPVRHTHCKNCSEVTCVSWKGVKSSWKHVTLITKPTQTILLLVFDGIYSIIPSGLRLYKDNQEVRKGGAE